jgi:hypothetical protein
VEDEVERDPKHGGESVREKKTELGREGQHRLWIKFLDLSA